MSYVFYAIEFVLLLLLWFWIIRKAIITRHAPVKTVKAEVVDKYKPNIVSRYPRTSNQERYIVVFATKHEKLSFDVSEISYNNYKIKEKGTLKYKGTKLISFQ